MIDRHSLVTDVNDVLRDESSPGDKADRIVDDVLIPSLTAYLESGERDRTILLVDAMAASSQASLERQRNSINRLLAERRQLLDRLSGHPT